jgi:hypothetical protein
VDDLADVLDHPSAAPEGMHFDRLDRTMERIRALLAPGA